MTENGQKPTIQRAVEVAVFAPIGFLQFAKDMVPPLVEQFVTRGRSRVEELQQQVENQLGQARILGRFAVSQGSEQVRRQVGSTLTEARQRGEQAARVVGVRRETDTTPEPAPKTEAAPAASGTNGNGTKPAADSSGLPIPDYDELSASQVVARLSGLSDGDLEAIRDYESSQRRRKTILTKIDQLTS